MMIYRYLKIKRRIFEIIEKAARKDVMSRMFDYLILMLILVNTIAIIVESYDFIPPQHCHILRKIELISVTIFTIEYILRLWTADIKYNFKFGATKSRIRFIVSFMALIDLFAILPFYLPMLIPFDLRFLRLFRLTRLIRLFKINRYSKAFSLIGKVIKDRKQELIATLSIMGFLIIIAATLIYYFESEVQPDKFPNIVASIWWAIATLTTVGYVDVFPVTTMGKLLASIIATLGIGLVALPTGIISSGFMDELNKQKEIVICPKCGEVIKRGQEDSDNVKR